MSNFSAHSITKGEIQDLIDGISEWVKETPVKTPIGNEDFIQLWD